jgi:hypothetical protein
VIYEVKPPVKPSTTLYAPQTIIPTKQIIVPDLGTAVPSEAVRIDVERLIKTYGVQGAEEIFNDIKNNNVIKEGIAEQLVTSGIVSKPTSATVKKTKKVFTLSSIPYANKLTDFIYNLFYSI